jgi:hypothetical protein
MGNSARPFQPVYGSNQILSATNPAASISLSTRNTSVRIVNIGDKLAYVRIGSGSQTASNADCPIVGGTEIILYKDEDQDTLSYIAFEDTTLFVQSGTGGI